MKRHVILAVSVLFALSAMFTAPANAARSRKLPANPKTPQQIEKWWQSGNTLPTRTTAKYPLREQNVINDTGINLLIDMSHRCDFFTLWHLGRELNKRGLRTIGSHATLDSVLNPDAKCRIRIPVADKVNPFAWWQPPKFNVVLTESKPGFPGYIARERQSLKRFIENGGGLVVSGSALRDEEQANQWSLNTMLAEYGASVVGGSENYEGKRYPKLKVSGDWQVITKGSGGNPIYAQRKYGKGRIVLLASSSLYRYNHKTRDDVNPKAGLLVKAVKWASAGADPVGGHTMFPVARGGGGGIYPESEVRIDGIVYFYSKNQIPALLDTVTNDFPAITEDIYAWLPSPEPDQPMYMILCSGAGGGWAVNAYLPKEASTISTSPDGIRSIFAHEQAHTMSGPCQAASHPFGGNRGEEHAGWFQGKIKAMYNGDKGPNRQCNKVFAKGYDASRKKPEDIFNKTNLEKWKTGHDRTMIWYVWQKFDDRYGPTWYPRWRWVQGERWKDEPERKLTWTESIEDMSIAVGEDLFPFFAATGKQLSCKRFKKAVFMGKTIDLPVAPIKPTPPGDVCLGAIGDYTRPIKVAKR